MLRFYDPGSGEYLRNFEAEQARADSEQAARQAEQARADFEQAARERAEARIRSCRKNWNEGTGEAEGRLCAGHCGAGDDGAAAQASAGLTCRGCPGLLPGYLPEIL